MVFQGECCTFSLEKTLNYLSCTKKLRNPSSLNDFRPVALTSIVMKCFERIILCYLKSQTESHCDPNQFEYKQNRSTDDATLTILHHAYMHSLGKNRFICPNSLR